MALHRTLLVVAALTAGCATAVSKPAASSLPPPAQEGATLPAPAAPPASEASTAPARRAPHDVAVARAVEAARALLGHREIVVGGVRYADGCAALVRAVFDEAGRPLPASARDAKGLHALLKREGRLRSSRPAVGDLVFLADRPSGQAEHVGLVERVGAGGTATVLHWTARGVVRLRVNSSQPWKARSEGGKILNDVLVVGGGRVPAGRLVVAWATLL